MRAPRRLGDGISLLSVLFRLSLIISRSSLLVNCSYYYRKTRAAAPASRRAEPPGHVLASCIIQHQKAHYYHIISPWRAKRYRAWRAGEWVNGAAAVARRWESGGDNFRNDLRPATRSPQPDLPRANSSGFYLRTLLFSSLR